MLRIIAGNKRGARLKLPPQHITRPTSDRARESIFNILHHQFCLNDGKDSLVDARVLDLFAGSGALGLEALSRGAQSCVFVESDQQVRRVLKENIDHLKMNTVCYVSPTSVEGDWTPPQKHFFPYDFVFMDPPYGQGWAPRILNRPSFQSQLSPNALIILEVESLDSLSPIAESYEIRDSRRYGKAHIIFLKPRFKEIGTNFA